jgi:hypothetical protein
MRYDEPMGSVRNLYFTKGAPVFPGSSRLGIQPKTPWWLVQDRTTSTSGSGAQKCGLENEYLYAPESFNAGKAVRNVPLTSRQVVWRESARERERESQGERARARPYVVVYSKVVVYYSKWTTSD